MIIKEDIALRDFRAWGGAVHTMEVLTYRQLDEIERILDMEIDVASLGFNATFVNDFLWFDRDTIAEWLGFTDWDALEKHNTESGEIEMEMAVISKNLSPEMAVVCGSLVQWQLYL